MPRQACLGSFLKYVRRTYFASHQSVTLCYALIPHAIATTAQH